MSGDVMDEPNPNWRTLTCPTCGWVAEELSLEVWCPGGHDPTKPRHSLKRMVMDEVNAARIRRGRKAESERMRRLKVRQSRTSGLGVPEAGMLRAGELGPVGLSQRLCTWQNGDERCDQPVRATNAKFCTFHAKTVKRAQGRGWKRGRGSKSNPPLALVNQGV